MSLLFEQIPALKGSEYKNVWTNLLREVRNSSSTDILRTPVDEVFLWRGTFAQELFVKQLRASDIIIGVNIIFPEYYLKYSAWLTQTALGGKVTGFRAETSCHYFSPERNRNLCREEITERLDRFHFAQIYDDPMLQAAANALSTPIIHTVGFMPLSSRAGAYRQRGYKLGFASGEKCFEAEIVQSDFVAL